MEEIEIEVTEETFKRLESMRKRKPNGKMETINDVITRLFNSLDKKKVEH